VNVIEAVFIGLGLNLIQIALFSPYKAIAFFLNCTNLNSQNMMLLRSIGKLFKSAQIII
jgi:hypothetical protein